MKIAVLMGGNSSEIDVSLVTGKAVNNALIELGHSVIACPYENDISDVIHVLKQADLVFNALHGGEGEDGTPSSKIVTFLERCESTPRRLILGKSPYPSSPRK